MTWSRILSARFFSLFRKDRLERQLDEELRIHPDLLTEENVHRGMTPDDARFAAMRSFGGIEQTKEAYREQWGLRMFDVFCRDLKCVTANPAVFPLPRSSRENPA